MAAPGAKQVSLEMAETSQAGLPLQIMGKPLSLSSQPVDLEQEQMPPKNGRKAKKPLSFHMTFLALNICVFLVSLDATALSVAVPVSSTLPAI
jgi:hypothetical protein